jgi:hypothetical protein
MMEATKLAAINKKQIKQGICAQNHLQVDLLSLCSTVSNCSPHINRTDHSAKWKKRRINQRIMQFEKAAQTSAE